MVEGTEVSKIVEIKNQVSTSRISDIYSRMGLFFQYTQEWATKKYSILSLYNVWLVGILIRTYHKPHKPYNPNNQGFSSERSCGNSHEILWALHFSKGAPLSKCSTSSTNCHNLCSLQKKMHNLDSNIQTAPGPRHPEPPCQGWYSRSGWRST